jgi:hypothetical protein
VALEIANWHARLRWKSGIPDLVISSFGQAAHIVGKLGRLDVLQTFLRLIYLQESKDLKHEKYDVPKNLTYRG